MTSLKKILHGNQIAFGYRIGYLFNFFTGPVYKWTQTELGLRRPEFAVLYCAANLPDASATDVVNLTGIPKNSVSRSVSKLVQDGYLKTQADQNDARRAILTLSSKGRRSYEQILPRFIARQQEMIAPLSSAERQELDRLLNKLVERHDDWARDE